MNSSPTHKNHVWLAPLAVVLLTFFFSACGTKKQLITPKGLHFARIGDSLPSAASNPFQGFQTRDTLFRDAIESKEVTWQALILMHKAGKIYLEEDFQGTGKIGRIRIESTDYRLKNKVKIGSTLSEILEASQDWEARPFPGFQLMELLSPKYPRIVLLLQVPGFEYGNAPATVPVEQLSGASRVVKIVVL